MMDTLKVVMVLAMILGRCTSDSLMATTINDETVTLTHGSSLLSMNNLSSSISSHAVNTTAAATEEMMMMAKSAELLTDNMVVVEESSTAAAAADQDVEASRDKKIGSVPRKGAAPKVKGRKGVTPFLEAEEPDKTASGTAAAFAVAVTTSTLHNTVIVNGTTTTPSTPAAKWKPTASGTERSEDEEEPGSDYTALIVGLSLGISLVLILVFVTYWRMKDAWERRQYKRVDRDFLIDGLYSDA